MEFEVSFGAWITRRRKALDLTRVEMAQLAGCSVSALRKIEADERRPSKQLAGLLAGCLGIAPDDRPAFVKAARGELRVERLSAPTLASNHQHQTSAFPFNLPIPPTPLIGRESELTALGQLLRDPQCRLLTVIGPGGIGKTRLAIEIATRYGGCFSDGVYFVSLASLNSPAFLVPAIGNALGFVFQGQIEPRIQLLDYLGAKQALLVLDNVEHLLEGVGLLGEVLARAPGVKLLTTSRERLNLHGEWLFDIQGLPVPTSDKIDGVEDFSAVALFVQSARRVQAGFVLRDGDRPCVVRICQVVEGMPLGIELAAAWVSMLTCEEIAHEIESSLDFLTTSMRDVPDRQRSLRAVFEHSWSLLSPGERRMLSRLSVFRGDFNREAAAQVAGVTLPGLLSLMSKSLVRRTESGCYDLHEVVRQYARSYLADDPQDETATLDRHCDLYLGLLRDRERALKSAAQRETIQELTDAIDNVRAGWSWAIQRDKFVLVGQALRCFGAFSDIRGWLRNGIDELELLVQALRTSPENDERQKVLGQALAQQSLLYFRQGQFNMALKLLDESLALLRPFENPALLTDPLIYSAVIMFLEGELERSQSLMDEGLESARAADDAWFEAYALYNTGYIASLQGRYTKAYQEMLDGLAIWRRLGDPRATALGLNYLSPTAIKLGHYEEAQAFLQESIRLTTQVGDRWGMGTAYRHLGLAALARGNVAEAQRHIQKSLDLFAGFITGWDVVRSLVYLGEATAVGGDLSAAERIFLDALHQALAAQAIPLALDALVGLAELRVRTGDAAGALALSLCVLGHTASTQEAQERAAQLHAQATSRLTPQEIDAINGRAPKKTLEAAVSEFLTDAPASNGTLERTSYT